MIQLISEQVSGTVIKQEDQVLGFNSIPTSPTKRQLQKRERRAIRSAPAGINTSPRKQSPSKGYEMNDNLNIVFKCSPSMYGKTLKLDKQDGTVNIKFEKVTTLLSARCL